MLQHVRNIGSAGLSYDIFNPLGMQNSNSVIASVLFNSGIDIAQYISGLPGTDYPGLTNLLDFDYQIVGSPAFDTSDMKIRGYDGDDRFEAGAGNDTFEGGRGNDSFLVGPGQDFFDGGTGEDSIDLRLEAAAQGAEIHLRAVQASDGSDAFELGVGSDIDLAVSIERIRLTDYSDCVRLLGNVGDLAGLNLTVEMGGSAVAFHQDEVDASQATAGIYFNLGSGNIVGLDQASDVSGTIGWLGVLGGVLLDSTDLKITGANSAIGTDYSDVLIGSSGGDLLAAIRAKAAAGHAVRRCVHYGDIR